MDAQSAACVRSVAWSATALGEAGETAVTVDELDAQNDRLNRAQEDLYRAALARLRERVS